MIYSLLTLHRALSGLQNGGEYADKPLTTLAATVGMLGILGTAAVTVAPDLIPRIALAISGAGAIGLLAAFESPKLRKYIHHLETLTTSFALGALAYYAPLEAALAVYPGLVFHKVLMNKVQGLPWNYHPTDDPDGSHYGLPVPKFLQGKKILLPWVRKKKWSWWHTIPEQYNIPRQSMKTRIILALLSSLAYAAYKFYM